jgi:predicted O-linked N-acetylglucosamine transferase (SPINDLY family)
LPAKENGYVTFGSLNNFAKVSLATLDLWSEILAATPPSRLILHAPESSCRETALRRLTRHRVAPDRIEFVKQQPWELYLQTWQKIDIALDPFPYCGGITTLDALWMGAPLISLAGRAAVNRSGRSILSNVGLPELAVDTPKQYLEAAISLASDSGRLADLRASLRNRMEQSPLRDAKGFARDVEAAWREMWRRWCRGEKRAT